MLSANAELLVVRGVELDHVTVYRWVHRFTPLLAEAARLLAASRCPLIAGLGTDGLRWHANRPLLAETGQHGGPVQVHDPRRVAYLREYLRIFSDLKAAG